MYSYRTIWYDTTRTRAGTVRPHGRAGSDPRLYKDYSESEILRYSRISTLAGAPFQARKANYLIGVFVCLLKLEGSR